MRETDVAVVGAGIYGTSTAYFLARSGISTVVVESDDIGSGASGANAGNIHLQLSPFSHASESDAWIADFARSLPFFLDALALWRRLAAETAFDIELRCPGGLMVAENERQLAMLEEKVALERSQGLAVEMIDGAEVLRRAPYLAPHVLGASACKDEGMANALLAVLALADGARAAGAEFMLGARVERIEPRGEGWKLLTTAGDVACRRVVLAAGSSSDSLAAPLGVDLPIRRRVIQMIATEACAPFVEHLVYHVEERLTLKQVANGNVLIGGGWEASRDDVFDRPAALRESIRSSLALAMRLVPRLADLSVIRTWAGPNIYTIDGRPILGAVPGHPGLYAAVCNTYGFTLGPLCGRLVASAVAETLTPEAASLLEPMSPGRFAAKTDAATIDTPGPEGKNPRLP